MCRPAISNDPGQAGKTLNNTRPRGTTPAAKAARDQGAFDQRRDARAGQRGGSSAKSASVAGDETLLSQIDRGQLIMPTVTPPRGGAGLQAGCAWHDTFCHAFGFARGAVRGVVGLADHVVDHTVGCFAWNEQGCLDAGARYVDAGKAFFADPVATTRAVVEGTVSDGLAAARRGTLGEWVGEEFAVDIALAAVTGGAAAAARRGARAAGTLVETRRLTPEPATTLDAGLSTRGIRPAPGTRVRPEGIPENWRIRGTRRSPGGTRYYDPANPGNSVRVMQGNPSSPFPTSQSPYVRWQQHGHPLDVAGNKLPTAELADAHIPLGDFRFQSELFR